MIAHCSLYFASILSVFLISPVNVDPKGRGVSSFNSLGWPDLYFWGEGRARIPDDIIHD